MRVVKKEFNIYSFSELAESAKDVARNWFSSCDSPDWFEHIEDDAASAGINISEFDLYRGAIRGSFSNSAKFTIDSIMENHGEMCETYKTAEKYKAQFKALGVDDESDDFADKYEELESEFLSEILQDYRIMLQKEYDYQNSNEYIDECILCNEYEFLENGSFFNG